MEIKMRMTNNCINKETEMEKKFMHTVILVTSIQRAEEIRIQISKCSQIKHDPEQPVFG